MPAITSALIALRLSGRLIVIQKAWPRLSCSTGAAVSLIERSPRVTGRRQAGVMVAAAVVADDVDLRDHAACRHLIAGGDVQCLHDAGQRRGMHVFHLHRFERDHRLARSNGLADRDLHGHDTAVHRRAQLAIAGCAHVPRARVTRGVDDLERLAAMGEPQAIAIAQPGGAFHHALASEAHTLGAEFEHVNLVGLPAERHLVAAAVHGASAWPSARGRRSRRAKRSAARVTADRSRHRAARPATSRSAAPQPARRRVDRRLRRDATGRRRVAR